ncbi:MAG: hypothetical protein Q4D98_11680 [Planctomycetia bacterium]|nr:hypothetical protein [Planctomycetia bacterium]
MKTCCFAVLFLSIPLFGWSQSMGTYAGYPIPGNPEIVSEPTIGELLAQDTSLAQDKPSQESVSREPGLLPDESRNARPAPQRATPVTFTEPAPQIPTSPEAPALKTLPEDLPRGDMGDNRNSIIAFTETMDGPEGRYQQITVIDPQKKSLCVYQIHLTTGQIELKSARDIQWDLQLVYLNSKKPLPNEVQAVLQSTRRR